MTDLARRFRPVALIPALIMLAGGALAAEPDAYPGDTGNYLAGRQALVALDTGAAESFFDSAASDDGWNNPTLVASDFMAQAANGDIDAAAVTARHLLELDAGSDLARLIIATTDLKARRYDAVVEQMNHLGTDNFIGITGAILKAWGYTGEGRLDDALKALAPLGKEGLGDFLVFHEALMADVAGDTERALTLGKKAYEADPTVARIVEAYVRMLGNAGRYDDALAVVKTYQAQGLAHPLIDAVKADLDKHQHPGLFAGNVQEGAAEMFHGIAVSMARDGNSDIAVVLLRLARYLDPHSDVVTLVLGQMLDRAGQHETANALYKTVPPDSPMRVTAVVRIALNLDAQHKRPEAIKRIKDALVQYPDDLQLLATLGDLQRFDKQFAASAQTYTKALDVVGGDHPADWTYFYNRGIAYQQAGDWAKAEPDFLKALDLNPDEPDVLNYLGYSWVDQGMHLDRALGMIQKAVKQVPQDGLVVDSLGWAYYKLGRIADAVRTLEQAVQLEPQDPQINDHLGDAYWRAGRKLEAKFQWRIASSLDKDGLLHDALVKKLKNGLDTPDKTVAGDTSHATGANGSPDPATSH